MKPIRLIPSILAAFFLTLITKDRIVSVFFHGAILSHKSSSTQMQSWVILFLVLIGIILGFQSIYLNQIQRKQSSPRLFLAIIGGLIGVAMFIYIYGLGTLDVTNVGWLMSSGDLPQHYIGWVFFRNSSWTFPFGISQSLGYPFGTSISFTDSIPLLALIFKLVSIFLPTPFQYFGIWTLLNFILQGIFSALIIYETTRNLPAAIISPLFFCMSNIFLMRIYGHSALSGQWILLISLYLYFLNKREKKYNAFWPLIFALGVLIHPYFVMMIAVIFFGTLLERFITDRRWQDILIWVGTSIAATLASMEMVGLFSGSVDLNTGGLGDYQANLNTLYNPQTSNWSVFIKPFPIAVTSMEGFNYLGLGMILLVCLALFSLLLSGSRLKWKDILHQSGLIIIISFLFIFSLSNTVSFNHIVLFTYQLPDPLMKVWNIFRSTGRMLWPVFYLIFIYTITQITRFLGNNRKVILVLLLAFLIQSADVSQIIQQKQEIYSHPQGKTTILTSPFWADAAKKYNSVMVLPLNSNDWQWVGEYASRNHMRLNYFYFARINLRLYAYANKNIAMLEQGKVTPGEMYLINDPALLYQLCKVFPDDTFFANVDGEWAIAPGFDKTPADYPGVLKTRADLNCK